MVNKYNKLIIPIIALIGTTQMNAITCPTISMSCYPSPCCPGTCDISINYAMNKQRTSISDRLDDFIGVIRANREQTNNQNKIIGQEILSYVRLRERIKKEALLLKNAAHLSRQIHGSTVIEHALKNIKKGK